MRLRSGLMMLAVSAVVAGYALPARALVIAMPRDVPNEILVTEADMIVVATVTAVPAPATAPAVPPGGARIRPMPMIRGIGATGPTTFKVEKMLSDRVKAELAGKEVSVMVNMFGAARAVNLKVGDKVVMALKQNNGQYYNLPYAKAFSTDVDATVKELTAALDFDKWSWGKESNGLRGVALSRGVQINPTNQKAMVQVAFGLQNNGKDSVFLNTFPGDQQLSLKAFWDGTPVVAQIPGNQNFGPYEAGAYTVELKPGEVAWLSYWGISPDGSNFMIDSPEGKCEISVVYSAARDGAAGGGKLWKGTVNSGSITVEIPKAGKTPGAGGPNGLGRGVMPIRPLQGAE